MEANPPAGEGPPAPAKILVMELAGLGDNIHLLPALWQIRTRWPAAALHLVVNAHVAGLFQLTPWVDRVWAYPSSPRPGFLENWRWGTRLRAERFDLAINTNGSDRSSFLTWLTRAPTRIGRLPFDGGPFGWRRLFTQVMESPFHAEPMYVQKLECLRDAGFAIAAPRAAPAFHVYIDPQLRREAGIESADEGRYFHLSPFTTADARELPLPQVAEFIAALRARFPGYRLILSCAGNARERAKMDVLLPLLGEAPWKTFCGTLDIPRLAAVIQASAMNFSGDTGSLHVALMTGAPAVAWFRAHRGQKEWIPLLPHYRVVIAEGGATNALHGIETKDLIAMTEEILEPRASGAAESFAHA